MLIIGSGPIVIGQAAEFDYAGTQACRALREEGVQTILVNSNPATIMTDPGVADAIYLEPLTVETVEAVIARERPDGLLAGLGGQTALNLAVALAGPAFWSATCAAARHAARRDPDGRGPRALPRPARPDRPAVCAVRHRRRRRRRRAAGIGRPRASNDRLPGDRAAGLHAGRHGRRHRATRGGLASASAPASGASPVGQVWSSAP